MLPQWTVPNNYNIATVSENLTVSIDLPLASTEGVTTKIISGSLPNGLYLADNVIQGTPFEVNRSKTSTFVIRASTANGISDRTFNLLVEGTDDPTWLTTAGRLPIGNNNTYFILDNSRVDFQLLATDPDIPAGDKLRFYISAGEIPPGLTLSEDGRITGFIDPLLALDVNVIGGGYDQHLYSQYPYDFAYGIDEEDRLPRKLNRNYQFEVTVTDDVSYVKREFQMFVVGDDFARADNTILKAADGIFTADFTYLRTPIWLTPSDLGTRRANNFLTIYLDAYDSNTLAGSIKYFLENINDDGTPSITPPGLTLDVNSGELAGIVPYQPAITKEYKFTVTATRVSEETQVVTVFRNFFEDTLAGNTTIKLEKATNEFSTGIDSLRSLVYKNITIDNYEYLVTSVNGSNASYDTITLNTALRPNSRFESLTVQRTALGGASHFFVNTLSEATKGFYVGKNINYSSTERYRIIDIFPYIEWDITCNGPIVLRESGTNDDLISTLSQQLAFGSRTAYVTETRNAQDEVTNVKLLIPATFQNRNTTFIRDLFDSADASPITATKLIDVDRVALNNPLTRVLSASLSLSITATRGTGFNKTLATEQELSLSKSKTFSIKLLGEVDSVIAWLTPKDLGVLDANRVSTISVLAKSSVPDSIVKYKIINGSLPPGLRMSNDGEIIGKVPITGTEEKPGLIFIDNGETTFDAGETTFDREYKFTVLARDKFEYSAIEREFTLRINDFDNINYSNVYIKPFLKVDQRNQFQRMLEDQKIFSAEAIYRPNDPNFGIQKSLKALVYAGIENKSLTDFVAATATNTRRNDSC